MTFLVFPTSTVAPGPEYPVTINRQPKLLTAKFGDNYEQEVGDGLNYQNMGSLNLSFQLLTNADYATFEAFLTARGGAGRFLYTAPGTGVQATYSCPSWTWSYISYNNWTLSAQFMRKFDVA
jgi:phage-related protein